MKIWEKERGKCFTSTGKSRIHDQLIEYEAISEETLLAGKDGSLAASMFSYTYMRTDVEDAEKRPVMFIYNGGPGSSSHLLHAGFFGTDRVKPADDDKTSVVPPFSTEENPCCLLDICDLVLIDPVETGFGRLISPAAAEEFFGVEQDAMSFVLFIEDWLTRYGRWNSPHFLCGESYGTLRSAVLADMLMGGVAVRRFTGISLNGIIMMGSTFHIDTFYEPIYIEPSVLNFISYAAANWYHHELNTVKLKDFVEEAYTFSLNEYARALLIGNQISAEDKASVIDKLNRFTGIPKDYFRRNGLRLETRDFLSNVVRSQGLEAGGYDSRVTLPLSNQIGPRDSFDDPSMAKSNPAYSSLFHCHFKKKLNIDLDRTYITTNIRSNLQWKWECSRTPAQSLAAAMRRNPNLHVMFATGLYDLCTCAGYARYIISQIGLPQDRVYRREYEGGHMIYTSQSAAAALEQDIRTFIAEII